jgi:hypothetical protein
LIDSGANPVDVVTIPVDLLKILATIGVGMGIPLLIWRWLGPDLVREKERQDLEEAKRILAQCGFEIVSKQPMVATDERQDQHSGTAARRDTAERDPVEEVAKIPRTWHERRADTVLRVQIIVSLVVIISCLVMIFRAGIVDGISQKAAILVLGMVVGNWLRMSPPSPPAAS